jgi:hypothetical protein
VSREAQRGRIFKVIFLNQGQVYEVYARTVAAAPILGFVEVEELVFGARSQLLVDSSEERLKVEFDGVKRFYLPMGAVVRIDEVEKPGMGRISASEKGDAKVAPFPTPVFTPGKDSGER